MKRALVLSLICVLGLALSGLAATLSGSWDTDVTINPQQTNFNDAITLDSVLTVAYNVGDWTFTSITTLSEAGWDDQDFSVAGVLGAFSIASALDFDPVNAAFGRWDTTAGVSIAGVSFSANFLLYHPAPIVSIGGIYDHTTFDDPYLGVVPVVTRVGTALYAVTFPAGNDLSLTLEASGVAGDVTFSAAVTFGSKAINYLTLTGAYVWNETTLAWETATVVIALPNTSGGWVIPTGTMIGDGTGFSFTYATDEECDLDWTGITIDIGFPFCCADIALEAEFDCSGFVSACFSVTDIVVPNVPYMTLDADLCFTMAEKTLVLTPGFDFGATACFDLYFDVASEGRLTIQDISIVGIGLNCDIGAVTFTGISYWGTGAKPGALYRTGYWEAYTIETNDDGCCGPFAFDLTFYFLEGGVRLFDIAEIDANMSLQVAAQFAFNMGLNVDVDTGAFSLWTVGFEVTW